MYWKERKIWTENKQKLNSYIVQGQKNLHNQITDFLFFLTLKVLILEPPQ